MRFKRVYIEISNICNLNCSFCSKGVLPKKSLSKEEFIHIINQIKPHTSFVYFHVKGEPLIHPLLEDFLDIAGQNEIAVNITTNGTLLKQQEELLLSHKAVRQVNLSLHSFGTGDEGGFEFDNDEYFSIALSFAKKASQKGIYVVMRLWNLNQDGKPSDKTLSVLQKIESEFELSYSLEEKMSQKELNSVKLCSHAFVGWEKEFVWPSLSHDFVSDEGFCYGMRHQIAILSNGVVVPCCLDADGQAPLGNIFITPFAEIIQTNRAKAIRHGFENRLATDPLCKRCSFRTKFD